jgi:serine/threonine protein kinase/tetratricopeptide (TPR) repeat protein
MRKVRMSDPTTADTIGPDDPKPGAADAAFAPFPSESARDRIGRYKLLELIGEGGFGSVWAAEQREPVKRRVALKIIKLGMDTRQVIARFEAERQALAMMDHPNIAKVFDAGATDTGRPFFVMELVKGVPIVEYCDREKIDTRARLHLFTLVCQAIQHAHQKGIIHRDIKPSNVLVTLHDGTPVPKVIDFGIAKATNQELTDKTIYTEHRQMIGTPAYMSPEQAEMSGLDIDTRSDIYSLGVLLYEMLTGTTPFSSEELNSAGLEGMMRMIREVEPHKPSTRLSSLSGTATHAAERRNVDVQKLGLLLRGDLDWIVMRCLEKDRTRRYDTANGLAADIGRHLNDEPVSASPPSTGYRVRKFVKRNKGQVVAGAAITAMLVLGIIGTTWGMAWALDEKTRADGQARLATTAAESERIAKLEAEANAQRAIEEAERAEAAEAEARSRAEELQLVADFQAEQLGAIEPQVMGMNLRRSLIEAVPDGNRDGLEGDLARVNFTSLALTTLEENIFERTIEAIDVQFADQPLVRASLLQTVAGTLRTLGLLDLAVQPQERAILIRREHLGDDHPQTLSSLNSMGLLLTNKGDLADAEAYLREALDGSRRTLGDEHPDTLGHVLNTGLLLQAKGQLAESEAYFREALEGFRRVLGDDRSETLTSITAMGASLRAQGKLAEAEPYFVEALAGHRRVLGDDHPETLTCMNSMAVLLSSQGRLPEAEAYHRQALEGRRRVLGDDHPSTLLSVNNLGVLLKEQGRFAEAEPYYREAIEGRRRVLGADHPSTLISISSLGSLLQTQGKFDEAEACYRQALEGHRRVLGDDHAYTLTSTSNMGFVFYQQGKLVEAERYWRTALEGNRRVLGDDHPNTLISLNSMGLVLSAQGRMDEAEPYRRASLEGNRRVLGDDHPSTLISIHNMGAFLRDLGRPDEAEALGAEAVRRGRVVLGEKHWNVGVFLGQHARSLAAMGRHRDAEERALESYSVLSTALGERHERSQQAAEMLADLYDAWHEAESGAGHDAAAAAWREKLAASPVQGG